MGWDGCIRFFFVCIKDLLKTTKNIFYLPSKPLFAFHLIIQKEKEMKVNFPVAEEKCLLSGRDPSAIPEMESIISSIIRYVFCVCVCVCVCLGESKAMNTTK